MLRRCVGAVSVSSIIPNKFTPRTRFVSSFASSYASQLASYPNTSWSGPLPVTDPRESSHTCSCPVLGFNVMLSNGMAPISDYNFILESLVKDGSYPTVFSLFNKLDESTQDIHTWAILIKCHSVYGNMSSAISLFHKIINTGHHPTAETLYYLLYGFCDRDQIHKAMHFYNDIILKKGFQLDHDCYLVLIEGLCKIGETHTAIQLLRRAVQIDRELGDFTLLLCYNSIIYRLCKDRLVNQAYDLYSEMIHVNNINPDSCTYSHLVYGYCILGQFKQAIEFFIQLEASRTASPTPPTLVTQRDMKSATGQFKQEIDLLMIKIELEAASRTAASPTPPTLVTEQDVKSARSVAAVMIKGGVKPNVACYRSVYDGLYKGQGGSKSNLMNKIEKKVKTLLLSVPDKFIGICYD